MKRKYLIWSVFALLLFASSCVKDELFNGPATISNVIQVPAAPSSSQDALVTARITDLKGITSVNLLYRVITGGTFSSIPMTSTAQYEYQGTIPATPFGTKVEYYIEVLNSGGFTSRYPEVENQFANYTVGASNLIKLYINEVFADGTKDETDPDWVEIYNGSDIPVDISGYSFYDQGIKNSGKPKRVLNAGTIIPSKAFFVLKTEYTGGEYAIEFGLSTSGDAVYLENASGILEASLDFLTISLSGKKSYGRQPDGSDNLVIFNTPTRGTSNNH